MCINIKGTATQATKVKTELINQEPIPLELLTNFILGDRRGSNMKVNPKAQYMRQNEFLEFSIGHLLRVMCLLTIVVHSRVETSEF